MLVLGWGGRGYVRTGGKGMKCRRRTDRWTWNLQGGRGELLLLLREG